MSKSYCDNGSIFTVPFPEDYEGSIDLYAVLTKHKEILNDSETILYLLNYRNLKPLNSMSFAYLHMFTSNETLRDILLHPIMVESKKKFGRFIFENERDIYDVCGKGDNFLNSLIGDFKLFDKSGKKCKGKIKEVKNDKIEELLF